MQELFFCDRSIRRTVYSNDLFQLFWLRCIAREKLGIYDVHYDVTSRNGKIAK